MWHCQQALISLAIECLQVNGEEPRSVFENQALSRDFFCQWAFGSAFFLLYLVITFGEA
ncbi:hypothetical protein KUC_2758 [Vreelandella boliviensis LC1]|uniref:Uncharacterized protein n=1 Tax=Vreelandella boliviensis LC1 TaxID=1072583 RepID=A0A7U9C1F3_9GAMM|nr:hypothetical protein KUC_2758 [Halomonas boliviensis LC1]